MRIKWRDGLIETIQSGGITGGNWGAETADRKSFFTLTDTAFGCRVTDISSNATAAGFVRRIQADMAEGKWTLDIETKAVQDKITITQHLTCEEPSVFQDYVMRFKFDKESFDHGVISGKQIIHKNTNIWYQFPVRQARLCGKHGSVIFTVIDSITQEKFSQQLYIRDEPRFWIVHARLIPAEPCDLYWIRWTNRCFRMSLSDGWSRRILAWNWAKKKLWFLAERRGGKPQLQAQGLAVLQPGQVLKLCVEVNFACE